MKFKSLAALLSAAGSLLFAAPSSAAIFYTVYQGVIASGQDNVGAFGATGALSGAFTAIFKVTDAPGSEHLTGPYSERFYGGPGSCGLGSGCMNPIVEASITINGQTVLFPGPAGSYGTVETANLTGVPGGGSPGVFSIAQTYFPHLTAQLNLNAFTLDAPTSFVAYSGAAAGDYQPYGRAYWSTIAGGIETVLFEADLSTTRVFITDDLNTAVPEPATWALMILGFSAAGAALRRRANHHAAGRA